MDQNKDDFKGYTLFNDIEDINLRTRNRAVIMANMLEFYTKSKKVSSKGAAMLMGYFNCIPQVERKRVHDQFVLNVAQRGYSNATA